jgi:hypothetical protein
LINIDKNWNTAITQIVGIRIEVLISRLSWRTSPARAKGRISCPDKRIGAPGARGAPAARAYAAPGLRDMRLGLAALALVISGCAGPVGRATRAEFTSAWLVPPNVLERWHEDKARNGPTFAGSPAWRRHMEFIERELRERGLAGLAREPIAYERWHTSDDPADGAWSLSVGGRGVEVASYWAYSGSTGPEGVTAPLVLYDPAAPPDVAGRIVVFDVPPLPEPLPPPFRPPRAEFASADLGPSGVATDQWYQSNYPTRFGRYDEILRRGRAAGGLVVFDMGRGRARGLYTFPLLSAEPVGVPGLYLDRAAGAVVREAARAGESATLRLRATTEPATAWFLSGVLPGRDFGSDDDELVLLVTHTDGPNLTQENGALAVLALIDYFAKLPAAERRRSLLVLLDPQHYMPGRHRVDWYAGHPALAARIVASLGVEQFGQREYGESGEDFLPTGRPETTIIFAQDNPRLVQEAIAAVQAEGLPRTVVRVPARGQGPWAGLGEVAVKRGIPGYGTSTEMSAYWSTAPGIESFDSALAHRQIGVLTRLTAFLMQAEAGEITVAGPAR